MADTPKDYRDPYYASLAADVEKRQGLPAGLLSSIITHGERSNADQVSEAGARTVAQITPTTRKLALDKFGIDAYLSPGNALEVAGLLLKDSLKRNDGDPTQAIGEYIGGTNRDNWGPTTKAYIDRVSQGLQSAKTSVLGADFAKWMAANPAEPAAAAAPATAPAAPAKGNPLDASFAAWVAGKRATSDDIPGMNGERVVQPTPAPEPSLGDKVIGAGEAGLNAITGATTGAVGMVGGAAKGLVNAVQNGTYGTPEGVQQVEQAASQGAQALTYEPRTASGQQQAAAVGNVLQSAIPVMPLAGELGMAGRAAQTTMPVVQDAGRAGAAVVRDAAGAVRDAAGSVKQRASEALGIEPPSSPAAAGPTPGTMGSVGAAGTDIATLRRQNAQDLPVPIDLTKGQATRDFEQTRFEREMAKDPTKGQQLRDFAEEQNARMLRNFDSFIDETGATKTDPVAVGDTVTRALRERAAADKNAIRVAYKNAEKAGAMEAPVSLSKVVDYLNEAAPDAATAPLVDTARKWAVKLGIAEEAQDGRLIPANSGAGSGVMNSRQGGGAVTLKTAETFRQAINRNTDFEPTNIRQATILKGLVDEATDGLGGDLYKQARMLRRQYAERYENFGLARDLLNNKRGMSDAIVPAEKVFQKSILSAPMADVKQIGRLLKTSGEPGRQAWAELQAAALRHIKDEATKNVARDSRGNSIVSASGLDKAVKQLDSAGKLDYLFGKKGAEQVRAINDLSKDVYTAPPGAINHSNTASVILAALDIATSGIAGMPLPVMSGLRILTTHVRDRKIQHRINDALGIKPAPKKVKAPQSILPSPNTIRLHESRTQH